MLLAALLPVRGAMAAAMMCPPQLGTPALELTTHAPAVHAHEHKHEHKHLHQHEGAASPHASIEKGPAQHDHDDGQGHERCSLCASCCSAVRLMSTLVRLPQALAAAQSFPPVFAPAPRFLSGAEERPPKGT